MKVIQQLYTILTESMRQATQSLSGNNLRSILSIIGIAIGIFCIISVKSSIDSLEDNIISGFKELGSNVIYVDKISWTTATQEEFLEQMKHPDPIYQECRLIEERATLAKRVSFAGMTSGKTVKYRSNSVSTVVIGGTEDYPAMFNMDLEGGRLFTIQEYNNGSNVAVLGYKVAEALFGSVDPLGKSVKISGLAYQVIGVLQSEGDNAFNFINYDNAVVLSFPNLKKIVSTRRGSSIGRFLCVEAKDGVSSEELKEELTGIMRSIRRIRPLDKDNFALNELSMLSMILDSIFAAMNIAGFLIGIFSLVVGMFSVANIMFVSVKERTNIIGVKKALGAHNYNILLEFLIESIILCLLGGLLGLALVYLLLWGVSNFTSFTLALSTTNIIMGVAFSIVVGVVAGIVPAFQASRLDPVVAMRG